MATLKDIRANVVRDTGRFDLIVSGDLTTNADNGLNRYIREAQRYLDGRWGFLKQQKRFEKALAIGDFSLELKDIVSVSALFVKDSDGVTDIVLQRVEPAELRTLILTDNSTPSALLTNFTSGQPTVWAFNNVIALSPELETEDATELAAAGVIDIDDVHHHTTSDPYPFHGILFNVKADKAYTISIQGQFRENDLPLDASTSWWTDTDNEKGLVLATIMVLEETQRNSQGVQTALENLNRYMSATDDAFVEGGFSGKTGIIAG